MSGLGWSWALRKVGLWRKPEAEREAAPEPAAHDTNVDVRPSALDIPAMPRLPTLSDVTLAQMSPYLPTEDMEALRATTKSEPRWIGGHVEDDEFGVITFPTVRSRRTA
jgi:hypothetical protein